MTPLQCPRCRAPLAPASPGLVQCPSCRGTVTIPAPGYHENQRNERKQIATLVGIALAVMYGLPLLMIIAYCLFSAVVAAVMIGIFAVAGAATQ